MASISARFSAGGMVIICLLQDSESNVESLFSPLSRFLVSSEVLKHRNTGMAYAHWRTGDRPFFCLLLKPQNHYFAYFLKSREFVFLIWLNLYLASSTYTSTIATCWSRSSSISYYSEWAVCVCVLSTLNKYFFISNRSLAGIVLDRRQEEACCWGQERVQNQEEVWRVRSFCLAMCAWACKG